MRYILAICITIALIVLFFFSLFSVAEYGIVSLIIAGASGYGLYKIFKPMYEGHKTGASKDGRSSGDDDSCCLASLIELMFFSDLTGGSDPGEWDDRPALAEHNKRKRR